MKFEKIGIEYSYIRAAFRELNSEKKPSEKSACKTYMRFINFIEQI